MNILKECQKALDTGISISYLAQKMQRNPSTLSRWLKGERNISTEIQNELIKVLRELKEQWNSIEV